MARARASGIAADIKAAFGAHRAGRLDEARDLYRQILRRDPRQPDALYLFGMLHLAAKRVDEGTALLKRALAARPNFPAALFNLGMAFKTQRQPIEAIEHLNRAIALEPTMAEAHAYLAEALLGQGKVAAAEASCDRALLLQPGMAVALTNLGRVRKAQGRVAEARDAYQRALAADPSQADAHSGLGVIFQTENEPAAAIASYRKAIAAQPDHIQAHVNLGINLLLTGEFAEGWTEFEWRLRTDGARREFGDEPRWAGEPMLGQVLLLRAEQGMGDTIQFCRYVTLAAARSGAEVVLEVQAPLRRLLADLPGVARAITIGEAVPRFDRWCPLASLPMVFGTTLATIPCAVPYLFVDPARVAAWRKRLSARGGVVVGLVWAGNPALGLMDQVDRRRSIALAQLAPLAGVGGVSFVSLQKGAAAAQAAAPPAGMRLADWTEELADFADTAALTTALDLVISVDTAVAHLAGALARPVWLLNRFDPDWRWLLGRNDSPWYPTLRQFRQPGYGEWDGVVAALRDALHEFAAGTSSEFIGKPCDPLQSAPAASGAVR